MNVKDLIEVDPEKMSGTPVFTGTRVPINHLFDYLKAGDSLNVFLTDFPTVKRKQALGVIELKRERLPSEHDCCLMNVYRSDSESTFLDMKSSPSIRIFHSNKT